MAQLEKLGHDYPWGQEWQSERCNHDSQALMAVDALAAQNDYGCYDLVGNGREKTCSLWGERLHEPGPHYPYSWKDDGRNDTQANDQVWRV